MMKTHESGFSLLELVIVLALFLIVAALALPSMREVMNDYRLTTSGHDVANMLQQARMAAVQANQPYYAQIDAAGNTTNIRASAQSAAEVAAGANPGDPTAMTAGSVAFNGNPPTHDQLDALVGGTPPANGVIGFSARGMPCTSTVPPSFICTPGAIGFEWFMQGSNGGWVAVTVTPAGRIRSWRQTSTGVWK